MYRKYLNDHMEDKEGADIIATAIDELIIAAFAITTVIAMYKMFMTCGLPRMLGLLSFAGFMPLTLYTEAVMFAAMIAPTLAEKSEIWRNVFKG